MTRPRAVSAAKRQAERLVRLSKLQAADRAAKARRLECGGTGPAPAAEMLRELLYFHVAQTRSAAGLCWVGPLRATLTSVVRRALEALPREPGRCRVCQCHELHACLEGCEWTSPAQDLCTACEDRLFGRV